MAEEVRCTLTAVSEHNGCLINPRTARHRGGVAGHELASRCAVGIV
jgi:hypothetical protein